MSLSVGDLFIKLGIKGDDGAVKGVKKVDKSLKGIVSTGFAVKAGLVAMAFGLQKLMMKSGNASAALNQFQHATGLSAETLQRWQYAGRQFNVSAEEVASSIVGIQDSVANMIADGSQVPKGWAMMAAETNLDHSKIRDSFYVAKKIQEFAKMGNADMARMLSKSLGMTNGMFAAMRQNAFNAKAFSRAPIYNNKEIMSNKKAQVGWANLNDKFDKSLGRMNAKFGPKLVKTLSDMVDVLFRLGEGLAYVADKIMLLDGVGNMLRSFTQVIELINGKPLDGMKIDPNSIFTKVAKYHPLALAAGGIQDVGQYFSSANKENSLREKIMKRKMSGDMPTNPNRKDPITVNQNLNFQHDGKDLQKVSGSLKEATKKAFRNMPTQAQEN